MWSGKMKANELRIGNLCYYHVEDSHEGDHDILNEVDYEDLRILFGRGSCGEYLPIPLTEEWLSSFNILESYLISNDVRTYFCEPISISINYESNIMLIFFKGELIGECKYIHQLQNLYFALTGEELTINPAK